MACGKSDPLFDGEEHIEAADFLRVGNGGKSFEMENSLAAMILAEPAGFYDVAAGLGITVAEKNFAELCKTLGEVREELRGDFAFVAAGAKDVCDDDPAWSFGAQM
jgi:hypothetical protein